MDFFTRFAEIMTSRFNTLLGRSERLEHVLPRIVGQMEEAVTVVRRYAAAVIAAQRYIRQELDSEKAGVLRWQDRARQALAAGDEGLAWRSLVYKHEHEAAVDRLTGQHAAARRSSEQVRSLLASLEARLMQARRRQGLLLTLDKAAEARAEVLEPVNRNGKPQGGTDCQSVLLTEFVSWDQELRELENELRVYAEFSEALVRPGNEFHRGEPNARIQEEMKKLREELVTPGVALCPR